ncbi:MAG: DUF2130 domain-containing protein [Candidatus Omnitrophica bacterium]|nr:DUF2130 domain-containing protein [Candidatus Omnitrophota bacterium]MDD5737744.1 DUF2130 domain-containing protein [Candidatus Omnitrophota bacterium]
MPQDFIKCPKCEELIPLSDALSRDIEERARQKYEMQLSEKETEYQNRLNKQREELREKLKKQAEEAVGTEIADLKIQAEDSKRKLKQAQENELALRKKQRELEEKEKALELETARKIDEERGKIESAVLMRFEEQHKLKDAEKDKKLSDTMKQVEELKRKMEQGSQQVQGEVLELEMEELFKREFPFDAIEPVSKGVRGADILQIVKTQSGRTCGKILWETKRVKNWSESWIPKLKEDQRDAKADIAVLVSEALPAGFHHFRQIDGIWVADIPSALSLALALRMVLIQVANAKEIESGKDDKKDLIYRYVTSTEFRNRVVAIIDAFRAMKEDLEAEKRAMQRIWGNREKQIERIISNTAGMYGDLEGLAGPALQQIKILELPGGNSEQEENHG